MWLKNPIIQRELVGMLRTKKALGVQVALAVALAVLVIIRWPSEAHVDLSGAASFQVLRVFGYGLMVGVMLLAPVFPATSIVAERQSGTLELLLNSPMSPWAIVTGKLVGVLGFVVVLLAISLPAAAACYAMGGVDLFQQLARMYMVLAVLALSYATMGLLISSYAATTESALRATYGLILLVGVISLGPYRFFYGQFEIMPVAQTATDWLRCLSPIPAMMDAMGDRGVTSRGLLSSGNLAGRYAVITLVATTIMIIWIIFRMNQRLFDRARAAGKITDERSAGVRAYRRIMYLWFFDPQRRSGLIGPLTNAVMVKEQRCRRFGRGNWMMRLIGVCLIVSLGLMLAASTQSIEQGVKTMGGIMILLQIALIILITPSLASGLISGELESRGWQLLLMTPLSARAIVRGKMFSVLVTLLLVLMATLPAYVVLIYIDPGQKIVAMKVVVSLVLTAALALFLSAAVSSLFRYTSVATAVTYTLLVGLCAGTMLFWLGQDAPFTVETVEMVLKFNPLAAALTLIEAPGFTAYKLVPANWWILAVMTAACLGVVVVRTWQLTRPQ